MSIIFNLIEQFETTNYAYQTYALIIIHTLTFVNKL